MHDFGVRDKLRASLQGLVGLKNLGGLTSPPIGLIANPPALRQEFLPRSRGEPRQEPALPLGPLVLTNVTHRLMAHGVVVIERQGRSARTLRLFGSCSGSWSSQYGATRAIIIASAPRARYATESDVLGSYA